MTDGQLSIEDLKLPEWSTAEILVTGYQVVQAQAVVTGSDIRLGNARVLIFKGSLEYFTAEKWEIRETDADNFEFRLGPVQRVNSPDGVYMLVVTPNDGHGGGRAHTAAALASAILGGSVIYRELFSNIWSTGVSSTQIKGPTFGPPKNFPAPSLDQDSVRLFKDAYLALEAAPQKTRIELSLRWFEEAHHTFNEDSLLRYWLAIETLAMPNTTNIRPANQMLARAYGKTDREISDEIELGRILNLRSQIVHDGLRVTIDPRLLNFAAAVYADLLEATLGLPCQGRALAEKATIGPSIVALIPNP
jgi:hypothetical protein